MTTNAELAKMLKEMQEQNTRLETRLEELEDRNVSSIMEKPAEVQAGFRDAPQNGGWVVRTPNRDYSGTTCGLRFVQGMAVISTTASNSKKRVSTLIYDFGYSAQPVSEKDLDSFNRHIADNLAELLAGKDTQMERKLTSTPPVVANVQGG